MRLLADYTLDSDMCLPSGEPPLTLNGPGSLFKLELSNAQQEQRGTDGVLSARLLFEADNLEAARGLAERYLAQSLNALTLATGRHFAPRSLRVIIDWTPGLEQRHANYFKSVPLWDRAEPELTSKYCQSAQHFLTVLQGDKRQTALRWHRLSLGADSVEDQFSYLWFALEIASEALKDKEKVPSLCPHCRGPLYCSARDKHPVHRKYPGQAIRATVARYVDPPDDAFETLQKIRHALMHGERMSSVLDNLQCSEEEAINMLAYVTRRAVIDMADTGDGSSGEPLELGYVEDIRRRRIIAAAHVLTGMLGGDPNDPKPADIPPLDFSVVRAEDAGPPPHSTT